MKTITTGILGAGRIGRLHGDNILRMNGVDLKAVVDPYAHLLADADPRRHHRTRGRGRQAHFLRKTDRSRAGSHPPNSSCRR
jgi:predicted dehydrogenase